MYPEALLIDDVNHICTCDNDDLGKASSSTSSSPDLRSRNSHVKHSWLFNFFKPSITLESCDDVHRLCFRYQWHCNFNPVIWVTVDFSIDMKLRFALYLCSFCFHLNKVTAFCSKAIKISNYKILIIFWDTLYTWVFMYILNLVFLLFNIERLKISYNAIVKIFWET